MFKLQTTDGTELAEFTRLLEAIQASEVKLTDDPELGEVEVWATHKFLVDRPKYIGKATHVPDADWQSVVGWLWAGQKIVPPGPVPDHMSDEDFETYVSDAYADDPAKAEGMRQMREAGWC